MGDDFVPPRLSWMGHAVCTGVKAPGERQFMRGPGKSYERVYEQKKTTAVLLWEGYERVSHFQFWSWVSEVYEKSAWATHVSSWRPDIQSVLTNVRPTKLDTNARDIRGPTDRWVLKGYLWADYERIMRRLWETEGHTVSRFLCLASNRNKNNKYIICPPLTSLWQDKKGA